MVSTRGSSQTSYNSIYSTVKKILLLTTVALVACDDREIKTYTIAKEPVVAGPTEPTSIGMKPKWKLPATWKELPATGMRAATFAVENVKVDISVVTFPGTAGGLLSNLNRWREQMGLPAVTSESEVETITLHGQPTQIVELNSPTEDKAILGAMYLREDNSWFVKMTGDKAAVSSQRANFESLANSFEFGSNHNHSANDG